MAGVALGGGGRRGMWQRGRGEGAGRGRRGAGGFRGGWGQGGSRGNGAVEFGRAVGTGMRAGDALAQEGGRRGGSEGSGSANSGGAEAESGMEAPRPAAWCWEGRGAAGRRCCGCVWGMRGSELRWRWVGGRGWSMCSSSGRDEWRRVGRRAGEPEGGAWMAGGAVWRGGTRA